MADFGGLVMTDQGKNLVALAQAGTAINFAHIALGSGVWPDGTDPETRTALVESAHTLPIQSISTPGDGSAILTAVLTNTGLESGFYFREIGLFADDPNNAGQKLLYAVAYAGDQYDYIPAQGGVFVEEMIKLITIVGNAQQVSAIISGTVIIASKQDIDEHDQSQAAHPGLRVQTPSLIVLGADSVNEGDPVTIGVQGYVPGVWDLEAKLAVEDADGNEIPDPFGLSWNMATGTATGTAPEVGAGGKTYKIKGQLWEHGLIRSTGWAQPVTITVGDVPINKPVITAPAAGATGVGETPTITTSAYSADDGQAHQATQVQISLAPDFATTVHDSGTLGAVEAYDVPAGQLATGQHYYIRARHQGASGTWSPWSASVDFFSAASFVWVEKPVISSPAAGATDVGETPEIQGSAYNTNGTGAHASTDWQLQAVGGDWSAPVWESLADAVNLTSATVPAGLLQVSTGYQVRCRYRDNSDPAVVSDWSEPVSFTSAATFSDSAKWAAGGAVAGPDTFEVFFDNPVAGGNEIGLGGTLTEAQRTLTQGGNVPGAVDGYRQMGATGQWFHNADGPAGFVVGQPQWSVIMRVRSGTGISIGLGWGAGRVVHATQGGMELSNDGRIPYSWLAGAGPRCATDGPTDGTPIYIYYDYNNGVERTGWSTSKVVSWQDIPAGQQCTTTGDTAGLYSSGISIGSAAVDYPAYEFQGAFSRLIISRQLLLVD